MKNIAMIPIDNRPVCYQLPMQIASLTNDYKLLLPDINLLGNLTKNADIEKILDWLNNIDNVDIVVVSLDTIAYGGLIPSRRSTDSYNVIKNRIIKFKKIIEKKQAKVYAFSSIMRISNNNINEEEKDYWSEFGTKIYAYSFNKHKSEKTGESIKTEKIPKEILEDYLSTRKRNFEINKLYIELQKEGLFDTLVFSKDDCSEYGFNVREAEELKAIAKKINVPALIKTGADEIPITLLSRAINKHKRIKICPSYINIDSIDKISKYEDISVKESVESQIELAGAIVSSKDNCDLELIINNFKIEQGELVMGVTEPLFKGKFTPPDNPYFIADILNANGSDNNFIEALLSNENLKDFYGYAAWNTTGNTLGSAISAAMTFFGSKHPNKKAFQTLLLTRLLDDWAYQANVRGKIRKDTKNLSETVLKAEMQDYEKKLFEKFGIKNINSSYKFPWNRFFEIQIDLSDIYFKVPFVDILFYE